ncbi:SRPBCC family protein [Nocardioides cynanchi]|uniref:SRPBCC family protein n=1 Tax=Nocardioides cynanchi TaxID=2558918 RepID=UPI001244D103|nr:SRPBCC family protein [Nocardioides cynanchi]
MELTHEFTVPVPVQEAWDHFQDIASVAQCFPGAQVTSVEDTTFNGSVKVKLGPISLVYNGSGTFTEKDETAHRFVVDAKGKDKRGNGTAGAKVTLAMTPNGDSTDVKVETDLAITGKPAQFGRGVMQDVSDKLLNQFVACLEQRMAREDSTAAPAEPAAADQAAAVPAAAEVTPDPAAPSSETPAAATPDPAAPAPVASAPAAAPPAAAAAPPAAAPKHAAPAAASPRGSDDALDLGATVLPVLAKAYWKQAVGALVVIGVVVWLVTR